MKAVSEIVRLHGKPCLLVDGVPFPHIGVQLRVDAFRNCMHLPPSALEPFFQAAQQCGFALIQLPIDWRDLEPAENEWHFDEVDALLEMALRYGLRVEYLWFSTNMCGDTHSYHVPDYVLENPERFPALSSPSQPFHPYYGDMSFLQLDSPELLRCESRAARMLLSRTTQWDLAHHSPHTVIGVQVHNEPNCLPDWRLDQLRICRDGLPLTREQAWRMILRALDAVGNAFHMEAYQIYTRVNLAVTANPVPWAEQIVRLTGIDMVGNDPYTEDLSALMTSLDAYRRLDGFPHIAENKAAYPSAAALLIAAVSSGAGYCFYDLSTPSFFVKHSTDPGIDHGLLDARLCPKPHTAAVCGAIRMLRALYAKLWDAGVEGVTTINLQNGTPDMHYAATLPVAGGMLRFETDSAACGVLVPDPHGGVWLGVNQPARIALDATESGDWQTLSAGQTVHLC